MKVKNLRSKNYKVDLSKYKAEFYEKIVSVKLLVIVIIVFKLYFLHKCFSKCSSYCNKDNTHLV